MQSLEVSSIFFDGMKKINHAWYTKEDQVSLFCFRTTQEQVDKERKRDENIKKMLIQMDLLQDNQMENVRKINESK